MALRCQEHFLCRRHRVLLCGKMEHKFAIPVELRNCQFDFKTHSEVPIMADRCKESEHPNLSQSSFLDRRSFLKLSASSLALPPASILVTDPANGLSASACVTSKGRGAPQHSQSGRSRK